MTVDYIAHHGIKGMKWGVRRYQNSDGTLTDAGRKRYKKALYNMSDDFGYDPDIERNRSFESTGVIPKGTEAYRYSYSKTENPLDKNRKYFSISPNAALDYTNPDLLSQIDTDWDAGHGFVYKAKKDLKIATTKDVEDYLASKSKNPQLAKKIVDDLRYTELPYDRVLGRAAKSHAEKQAIEWMNKAQYWYGQRLASGNLFNTKYDESNPVFEHFSKLGYDAISDIEDGGIGGPLGAAIVLNPKESFTAKVYNDRDEYYDYVTQQTKKYWAH
jgi:hypothetical protein